MFIQEKWLNLRKTSKLCAISLPCPASPLLCGGLKANNIITMVAVNSPASQLLEGEERGFCREAVYMNGSKHMERYAISLVVRKMYIRIIVK